MTIHILCFCSMSDHVTVNINSVETSISNNVTHHATSGDTRVTTNINDTSDDNTNNASDINHGHGASSSNGQATIDLNVQRTSCLMLLIALVLVVIAFLVTMKLPDPARVPMNLIKAFEITSKVLYLWGMFLLLFALCGTQEVSMPYAIYQRTFLWASFPLVVVVISLKVAVSIVSQLHS